MAEIQGATPRESSWWARVREGAFIVFSLVVSGAVAYVTGKGSWLHIVHIGHMVGEPSADWLPVAIDGMMLNGTILVAVDRFRGRVARPWAVISLWLGTVMTLAFNVASAWERGFWAMVIAACYAIALLCTVEAVFHPSRTTIDEAMARRAARKASKMPAPADVTPAQSAAPVQPVDVPAPAVTVIPTESAPTAPVVEAAPAPVKAGRSRRAAPRTTARPPVAPTKAARAEEASRKGSRRGAGEVTDAPVAPVVTRPVFVEPTPASELADVAVPDAVPVS